MDAVHDGVNRWHLRKDRVINLIRHYVPDLIGVQEPLPHQMDDLQTGLSDYDFYGVGRDNGKDIGEFSAIFYRHDRFELNDKGTFWLSETPDTPGKKGWDAACTRICSWVKMKDRLTNKEIFHFNTHLDHEGETARREGSCLISARIKEIAGSSTPVILTGDFNAKPESDAYRAIITNTHLQDAKNLTESPHSGPDGTWSTFNVKYGIGDRIDYIFITLSHFKILQHAHLIDSDNEFYPSDHLPVLAELAYKN